MYNNLVQPAFLGGNAKFYTEQENYERLVGDTDFGMVLIFSAQAGMKKP